jgi:hypothetical protein
MPLSGGPPGPGMRVPKILRKAEIVHISHDEACFLFFDRPRRREAAFSHSTIFFLLGQGEYMAMNLKHSPEGLKAFEHHLVYEVNMLQHTFGFLNVPAWNRELLNAIIESFCAHAHRDNSVLHSFAEDNFTAQFLLLKDNERNLMLRVPTQGGMLEWSLDERFKDCDLKYCWGDVEQATMFR